MTKTVLSGILYNIENNTERHKTTVKGCNLAIKIKTYVIAGQSNALGITPVPANAENQDLGDSLFYQRCNVPLNTSGSLMKIRFGLGSDESRFGLEAGAARALRQVAGKKCIIKYSSDGTSLFDRWNSRGGEDYNNLIKTVSEGYEKLVLAGYAPEFCGVLWMQGENDAIFEEQADAYEENLLNFIAAIRKIYGEDLPFVIGETKPDNPRLPFALKVNSAKRRVCGALENVFYVPTGDLKGLIDGYHYG